MDLHKIISELQSEKQRLDEAIQALERLSSTVSLSSLTTGKKRGRPPLAKNSLAEKDTQAKAIAQT